VSDDKPTKPDIVCRQPDKSPDIVDKLPDNPDNAADIVDNSPDIVRHPPDIVDKFLQTSLKANARIIAKRT
jgi:hypothetical protein